MLGWAATILYNQSIREQFLKFRERTDTFSLGVCNGCQLMGLLGWIAQDEDQKGRYIVCIYGPLKSIMFPFIHTNFV